MLNRFQQATAALPDATVVLTEGERIEWWNDAGENLLATVTDTISYDGPFETSRTRTIA